MADQPAPASSQAITVVQPPQPAPAMSINVEALGAWAGALLAIAAVIALFHKLMTRELVRDLARMREDLGETDKRVDALEAHRVEDIARMVKVETSLTNMEEMVARIERTINGRFDDVVQSLREIRVVSPRG